MFKGERKIFPRNRNHRRAHHRPDRPSVQTYPSDCIFAPNGTDCPLKKGFVESKTVYETPSGYPQKGTIYTERVKCPIVKFYKTSIGGVRTGGGGTSDESLARGKRKFGKHK